MRAPHPISALPPLHARSEASPKAISGRTSYLRVRLAFHPYPRLIPWLFNASGFGPPVRVTEPSPWTGVDHPVSGLRLHTHRPVQTRFRCGSGPKALTSHANATRRFILQKARHHPLTGSDFLQAHGFRFSFTPLPRCFSPFPHGTGSLSVAREYLALADGPACFTRGSPCPALLGIRSGGDAFSATGLLPPMASLSRLLRLTRPFVTPCGTSHNPAGFPRRFGLLRVRSPLLTESRLFSSPPGT